MTTRRGAKGTSNHTSSAGPSSASSGSRRNSLDENAQNDEAPGEHEDARPAKRSRTLSASGSPQRCNGSRDASTHDDNSNNTHDNSSSITPMNGTHTPELHKPAPAATSTAPRTAGKKRRASDGSTHSTKTRPNGLLTRTQSDVSDQQPRKKRRTKDSAADTPADQLPELTDASTAPNSPEHMPDVDGSQSLHNVLPASGDAPAKSGRRLPGRRRQPHPDINVETDLRRQLNLKMSYRSLAKVQKLLLEELAARTTKSLEHDANFHRQCPEYHAVMAQLDQRRDARLNQVNALRTYRLEQMERVRLAEEHIQKEQYINRFRELQDDFVLQIYFRAKKLEREMKGHDANATDDEDNVLPPTYSDEPHHAQDDRIGSKFASRSRAYVEADRELEHESIRKRFSQARAAFVEKDEEADDSIDDVAGGFARFDGPDRTEAIAHYNINRLADAAHEVERTPSPQPEPPKPEVIPNEHADLLMILADVSSNQPRSVTVPKPPLHYPHPQQQPPPPPPRAKTPVIKQEHPREKSPEYAQPAMPSDVPSQTARDSPAESTRPAVDVTHEPPRSEPQAPAPAKEPEAPAKSTPRLSTHRIMDILNDDCEVPVSRTREQQPPPQEKITMPTQDPSIHRRTSSRSDALRVDDMVNKEEPPVDQALMDALSGPQPPSNPPSSPPSNPQPWPRSNVPPPTREPEESLRRRDPLQKIRELLDKKAREHGRDPSDRPSYGRPPVFTNKPNPQPPSGHDRAEVAAYDPTRPSTGLYGSLPGGSYGYASRRESHEQSAHHWEHDRRMSGSQAPQSSTASPYQSHAAHPHYGEHHRSGPTPPTHQSPYAPPASTLPLPAKPPGPPPPINYRFAHYDPAPPRTYPQSPNYPPTSHPPQSTSQPQYTNPYGSAPPYQSGYIPPPGSFQAPPPPPSSMPPYQPLKIHQYGGQPILPANMAPPPPQQHTGPPPTLPFISQAPPPPSLHASSQAQGPQQAYSPTHPHPSPLQYEQQQLEGPSQNGSTERSSDSQSRPRRPYRSYHAPGTQFRSYQGPGEQRRRGG
ncbi:hypothetical protein ACJQWK_02128 [Exserohilum turcicum]